MSQIHLAVNSKQICGNYHYLTETRQATLRKRKQPNDDLSQKFDKFENKIISILSTMSQVQSDKLDKIPQELSLVTNQITQLRSTTTQLVKEQNRLIKN
ncbi:unnamed protein product [Parnassius apollo]|uniref:(apollo) hypothetical protein n=1 Tax=Parnassius apollo TaxID=110799 RepID=A0A8S3X898_PARAO|nr:unnamed protein product [Parnassius apollo]